MNEYSGNNELLKHALQLASKSFYILPLQSRAKKPLGELVPNGFKNASSNPELIKQWWGQYSQANIGLVVGEKAGLCVIDIDFRNGGEISLKELEKVYGPMPETVKVQTGNGVHYYFKYPKDVKIPNSLGKGIDVKNNGYVLAPPSIHPSGVQYAWINSFEEMSLSVLPQWIVKKDFNAKCSLSHLYKGSSEGSRNNDLARLTGSWVNDGLTLNECLENADIWNSKNNPPLSADEIKKTIESIYNGHYTRHPEKDFVEILSSPEDINEFIKRDIPPLEFYICHMLQKGGRTLISAPTNVGKSIYSQNLALALTSYAPFFLDEKFSVKAARTLYLDFEMGESLLKERSMKMLSQHFETKGLFIKSCMAKDLLDDSMRRNLEEWLDSLKIEVLILDPIGSAWSGNENDKQEVARLTSYLDSLIERYGISIVIIHHWRKSTKDRSSGGEMAAGSYKWAAWADNHIILEGVINNLRVSCQKARGGKRFEDFRIVLDEQALTFKYLGDYSKKFTGVDVLEVFESFCQERVKVTDLIKKAKQMGKGSPETIRKLIKNSQLFDVDKTQKAHFLLKKKI